MDTGAGMMGTYGTPPPVGMPGIDMSGPQAASQMYGAMAQQQWLQYTSQFVPIENQLIAYSQNQALPQQNMQRAITDVQQQQAGSAGVQARALGRFGETLRPDEQAASTRDVGLSQSLAQVGAANRARDVTVDTQRSILGAPMPNVSSGGVPGVNPTGVM